MKCLNQRRVEAGGGAHKGNKKAGHGQVCQDVGEVGLLLLVLDGACSNDKKCVCIEVACAWSRWKRKGLKDTTSSVSRAKWIQKSSGNSITQSCFFFAACK